MSTLDEEHEEYPCLATFGFYIKKSPEDFRTYLDSLLVKFAVWLSKNCKGTINYINDDPLKGGWAPSTQTAIFNENLEKKVRKYALRKYDGSKKEAKHIHFRYQTGGIVLVNLFEEYLKALGLECDKDWDRLDE